jgi:hypothetical protein
MESGWWIKGEQGLGNGEWGAGVVVSGRGGNNERGLGEKEVESGWWIRGNRERGMGNGGGGQRPAT